MRIDATSDQEKRAQKYFSADGKCFVARNFSRQPGSVTTKIFFSRVAKIAR